MKSIIKIFTFIILLGFTGNLFAQTAQASTAPTTAQNTVVAAPGDSTAVNIEKQDVSTQTALISVEKANTPADKSFLNPSSLANSGVKLIMMIIGLIFVLGSIRLNYQPLLLVPIGIGILITNIPFFLTGNMPLSIFEENSFFNFFYKGLSYGIYPSLIFIGIGAMTDFSSLIANPKLMLLGAASQIGILVALVIGVGYGFNLNEAASMGMIGGADGPISIFAATNMAPGLLIPIALSAYAFMALVPVIQPPIMKLLTSKKERVIRMKPMRAVSANEKILFPVVGLILTGIIVPRALPMLGMLFFGNILKESGYTKRLAFTASNTMLDIVTILLGITLGAAAQPEILLTNKALMIFVIGGAAFIVATVCGILFDKLMNLFLSKENKINPLIGNAGVSALPDSARISQLEGLKADPTNHLLSHAMAPNVAGVISSAIAAGILMSFLM